ncbi:MAG: hypothetical protein E7205_12890 [Tissierellaceae bacterium]|jgi:hypothetical protein|nr:hypothetical protein [Tissierellaceae bacterium]
MDNLWILTEERPKPSVILQIVNLYCQDFGVVHSKHSNPDVRPLIINGIFQFTYIVEGIQLSGINQIFIKIVSGSSSFFDFLVFKQEDEPIDGQMGNLLMAIEETKTSDDESRNTGVYQRASKFVFIAPYTTTAKLYMLYNDELGAREDKKPSDTSIFGTNMLLTLGVKIVGKDTSRWFGPFTSLEDIIRFKMGMRKPPIGNVPIDISLYNDRIEISGRLAKPADEGNIGHDPNIGALSIISKCLRHLGWQHDIVITQHGVSQSYVDRTRGRNKFLYICSILGLRLEGIDMPPNGDLPETYWHYEMRSEKVASILLHVLGEYYGMRGIYQNHAGCERGYYKTPTNNLIALPKKDSHGENLYLPDLVLHDPNSNTILLVEGKKLSKLLDGIIEIQFYDSIENEYIRKHYPQCKIYRYVSIFGGNKKGALPLPIILYLNEQGQIFINPNAPQCVKNIFLREGVRIGS